MQGGDHRTIRLERGGEFPRRFVFVLLESFTMVSFACALEALRLANLAIGRQVYSWSLVGEGGTDARCSAGTRFALDDDLVETRPGDVIVVCGGRDIARATTPGAVAWLREQAVRGAVVGGVCTAAWALARAGLLDGVRATIHWENQDSFAREFPDVLLTSSVYVADGARFTAAGGTASLDLMLKLISDEHGEDVANQVADQVIYSSIRSDQDTQRLSVPSRIGVRHPRLAQVIQRMEAHIQDTISPAVLARDAGLSPRQLERLFRRYLNRSPKRYYMELRLRKARNLLLQTDMSVINVALACGFTSPSHFSKCYRAYYNTTPYRERGIPSRRMTV